eukprot:TRINITY_DN7313_c0_g4_i3.p1 TRINITY_DN7313_c0_g4~~TRINITY_DN7313_c0_g4_i3.p1  ORF type:complete len:530 (+),score=67.31 TRINITY_DN7313_c0_g4_i3:3-1592(+)
MITGVSVPLPSMLPKVRMGNSLAVVIDFMSFKNFCLPAITLCLIHIVCVIYPTNCIIIMKKYFFLAFSLVSAMDFSAFDAQSVNSLFQHSFLELKAFIASHIEETKPSVNTDTLSYSLESIDNFSISFKAAQRSDINNGIIYYKIGNPFKLIIPAFYIWAYGFFPIAGTCTLHIEATNFVYSLRGENDRLVPAYSVDFEIKILDISNLAARLLGVEDEMEDTIGSIEAFLASLFRKAFNAKVITMYNRVHRNLSCNITYLYSSKRPIPVESKLKRIGLSDSLYGNIVISQYDKGVSEGEVGEFPNKRFGRCVEFEAKDLENIFSQALKLVDEIELSEKMIKKNSLFHLDAKSLSRIYAELLYMKHITGIVVFKGKESKTRASYLSKRNVLEVSGIKMEIEIFMQNSKEKTLLVSTELTLTGIFQPIFKGVGEGIDAQTIMKLNATGIIITEMQINKQWNNPHAILDKKGLRAFIRNMVEDYFIYYYTEEALGSGLLVMKGGKLTTGIYYNKTSTVHGVCLHYAHPLTLP